MGDDIEEGKSGSTLYTAELEIKWDYYGCFVNDDDHKLKIEDVEKVVEVKKSGIYKLMPEDQSELYVGEGQSVHERLSDYKNARYELQEKNEHTDRRIQGWMLRLINERKGHIEIRVCTEAYIRHRDGTKQKLDLDKKHNRLLIENLEISISAEKFRLQNDRKNWEPRPAQSQIKTE